MSYITVGRLEPGDVGTDHTLRAMASMARAAAPLIPAWYPTTADGIRAFLADHFQFLHDPPGAELVRNPLALVQEIERAGVARGDCDDAAVLGAAIGLAAGLTPTFRVVGFSSDGPYAHVWTELHGRDGRSPVDLDIFRPLELPAETMIQREAALEV